MFGPSQKEWNRMLIVASVVMAVAGYGVLRFVEWIVSHLSVNWL